MKIEVDSNVIRRLIAQKLVDGTCAGFALVYDSWTQKLVCLASEAAEGHPMVLVLPLGDLDVPREALAGSLQAAQDWLAQKWAWVEIAHDMEDSLEVHGYWLQWQDPEHYQIGGTALARRI